MRLQYPFEMLYDFHEIVRITGHDLVTVGIGDYAFVYSREYKPSSTTSIFGGILTNRVILI